MVPQVMPVLKRFFREATNVASLKSFLTTRFIVSIYERKMPFAE